MSIKLSVAVRNARLDAIETTVGTGAIVKIWSGAPPAACADANSGTELVSFTLASDWAGAASSGSKAFSGVPLTVSASATGVAGHYRVYASDGTTCHAQGTVATAGGDMSIDNTSISLGQDVNITSWSITDGNG